MQKMRLNRQSFSERPFACNDNKHAAPTCWHLEVNEMRLASTGKLTYYAGCTGCRVNAISDSRAVVQSVVDKHNAKVRP